MKKENIIKILTAFNFFYGIKVCGIELDKNEQLFLGLVSARLNRNKRQPDPVYIHGNEFSSLLGKDAPLKKVRESLESKGLIHVRNYSMDEGRPRNYLLSKKVNQALRSSKKHEYVQYKRRGRIKSPQTTLNFHLALRFERIGLDLSVIELLDCDLSEREISRVAHDAWRILGMQHYSKVGTTGRDFTLINGIKSELRQYLTYGGKKLVEGDISACHPTLLTTYYETYDLSPVERQCYLKCIQSSDFYEYIFKKVNQRGFEGDERKMFKTSWNSWLNGSGNIAIEKVMTACFPSITGKIVELGKENARILQRIESSVLVDKCYDIAEQWERPYFSIHDGFICYDHDFEGFKALIQKSFRAKLGFKLKITKETNVACDLESGWIDPKILQEKIERRNPKQTTEVEASPYLRDKQYLNSHSIRYIAHDEKQFMEIGELKWHPESRTAKAPQTGNERKKFKSLTDCLESVKPKEIHDN